MRFALARSATFCTAVDRVITNAASGKRQRLIAKSRNVSLQGPNCDLRTTGRIALPNARVKSTSPSETVKIATPARARQLLLVGWRDADPAARDRDHVPVRHSRATRRGAQVKGADGPIDASVEAAFWNALKSVDKAIQIIVIENKELRNDAARAVHYEWFAGDTAQDGDRVAFIPARTAQAGE
jgi:hypothetical protein